MNVNCQHKPNRIFTIPNLLSVFRLLLIPWILWLYWARRSAVLAGSLLLLSGVTDILDGWIARKFHMVSDLGKILDPVADKLTQGAILVSLWFRFPLMAFPFLLMAVKELLIGVSGLLVVRRTGQVDSAEWHGKTATVLLYLMMVLHLLLPDISPALSLVMVILCCGMILLSLVLYGARNLKQLRAAQSSKK